MQLSKRPRSTHLDVVVKGQHAVDVQTCCIGTGLCTRPDGISRSTAQQAGAPSTRHGGAQAGARTRQGGAQQQEEDVPGERDRVEHGLKKLSASIDTHRKTRGGVRHRHSQEHIHWLSLVWKGVLGAEEVRVGVKTVMAAARRQ